MRGKTYEVALTGVLGGLAVILVFAGATLPGVDTSMFVLSSLPMGVLLAMRHGESRAWAVGLLFFAGTAILALLIVPNKIGGMPYVFCFGYYGLLRFYAEKIGRRVLGYLVKAAGFFCGFGLGLFFFKEVFLNLGKGKVDQLWLIPGMALGVLLFFMYDYVYGRLIELAIKKIKKRAELF